MIQSVSAFPLIAGVIYGALHYRSLEHDKTRALKNCMGNFDCPVSLSEDSYRELDWWIKHIDQSFNVISHGQPSLTLTTAASRRGCSWSTREKSFHINFSELLAVFMGLQTFRKSLRNTHIRLLIDNTTAIAVLNHMGTSHIILILAIASGKKFGNGGVLPGIFGMDKCRAYSRVSKYHCRFRIQENAFQHRMDD